MEDNTIELLVNYLKTLLMDTKINKEGPECLVKNEDFQELVSVIKVIRNATGELGVGNLSYKIRGSGYVLGSLKSLQSTLNNLTWTTKAIADGDFSQRVHFLGDFSDAFNRMTEKLESSTQESEEARSHFEMIFQTIPDATIISSVENGSLIAYNEAFFEMTKFCREEIEKNPINICDFYANMNEENIFVETLKVDGEIQNMEISFLGGDEKNHIGLISAKLILLEGKPHVLSVIRDISERKIMEEKIRRLSITDPLTQIYNRLKLDEELLKELKQAKTLSSTFAVLILDIDYFKRINDTYGHQVGDQVLIEIVSIIKSNVRQGDVVGRWGGEEFLIILSNASLEDSLLKAEKIRIQVKETIFTNDARLTISIGVAAYMNDLLPENIVFRADAALYRAKEKGRNRVEF